MLAEIMKHKTTVIIADDHALLREAMRNLLDRQDDIELVGEARDGEEAVRLSAELTPDIAIMDIVIFPLIKKNTGFRQWAM